MFSGRAGAGLKTILRKILSKTFGDLVKMTSTIKVAGAKLEATFRGCCIDAEAATYLFVVFMVKLTVNMTSQFQDKISQSFDFYLILLYQRQHLSAVKNRKLCGAALQHLLKNANCAAECGENCQIMRRNCGEYSLKVR